MKHLLFLFICATFFLSTSIYGYTLTNEDQHFVQAIQDTVEESVNSSSVPSLTLVKWYYAFVYAHQFQAPGSRIDALIKEIKPGLRTRIDDAKQPNIDLMQETVDTYFDTMLTTGEAMPERCFDYYQELDDRAWALDVPTALIGATWKMESSCKLAHYPNGMFQIMSKNYPDETMTTHRLIQELQDVVVFFAHKRSWYNSVNEEADHITFTYQDRNFDDFIKHGALYNGLSGGKIVGDIQPMQEEYVYGNLTAAYSGAAKDGLLVNIVKFMHQELQRQ